MTLKQAQDEVDQWIKTKGVRYFSELTNMAILTEEVGEVARIIARRYGEQSEKESDYSKDLGDEIAVRLSHRRLLVNPGARYRESGSTRAGKDSSIGLGDNRGKRS